ncbi:MAG: histidine phosphatase family protein [Candidatus Nealsonbacteria bacterium]|nr:histidine phosphatase family protein [Candidatus Nealsonbacteria bacterium]
MKLKNRYFLLRHGENNYQVKRKEFAYPAIDTLSVKLTEKGIRQIKKAARLLKKEGIDLIYSSDFFRARQTSKIVAKELNIKKINLDKRLRDTNMGVYHGRAKKEFYKFLGYKNRKFSTKPPKGESWDDVEKREVGFVKEVDKKYKNKNILIVGHGDPLRLLEGAVKGLSHKEFLSQIFTDKDYIKVGELRKIN